MGQRAKPLESNPHHDAILYFSSLLFFLYGRISSFGQWGNMIFLAFRLFSFFVFGSEGEQTVQLSLSDLGAHVYWRWWGTGPIRVLRNKKKKLQTLDGLVASSLYCNHSRLL